ncbi:thiol reductant ABC exporter subunit CydC [Microlunatus ginsengisoli]|uniref:ATP-binding cassette, subfamily C, CydC n=1 Tax=Microlunatus ginsengisoli TaxID=363863 RepID=A0ABP6ZI28_9ACTN
MIGIGPRGDRGRLLGAVGLGALASACGVALMGTSGWLLSRAAEHPPVMYLMVAIVCVRAFGLGKGVLRYAERLVGHDLALRRQAALRIETYRALARSTWVGRGSGDLLSRLVNDVEAVQDLVVRAIVPMASAALVVVGTVTVLGVLSPAAGAIVLGSALLAGALVPWLARRLGATATAALAPLRGELAAAVAEAAEAAPDLLAYGAAPAALNRVAEVDGRLRAAEARLAWTSGVAAAAQVLAAALAVTGTLLVGAAQVAAGALPPVQLAVLVLTPLALHEVLGTLPAAALALGRSQTALRRVREILDAPVVGTPERAESARTESAGTESAGTESAGTESAGTGSDRTGSDRMGRAGDGLRLSGLAAGWPGSRPVTAGLDLSVAPGERVALVGPSGVGKTTVAATILGLLPPMDGSVQLAGSVGYLAQDAYLFDTTVAENVRIGKRDATDAEIAAALRAARLDLAPDRLVGLHGAEVSGGEARRIALARLLVRSDDVLILDEPTEHLDGPTAAALLTDLWDLSRDAAVVMITHDLDLAADCDRTYDLGPAQRCEAQH